MILVQWKVILRLKCSLNGGKKNFSQQMNYVWIFLTEFKIEFEVYLPRALVLFSVWWLLTFDTNSLWSSSRSCSETFRSFRKRWPLAFWDLAKHLRILTCFPVFGVWQILTCILSSTFFWILVQEYLGRINR